MTRWLYRRKSRVLLIPNHWSGSVQEYYHFLLGYLGPIMLWVARNPEKQIAVRDCGPMNIWIDTFLTDTDVELLNPGAMLHLFAGKVHRSTVLRGFDDPASFDSRRLNEFRNLILEKTHHKPGRSQLGGTDGDNLEVAKSITVVDRASSGAFNDTNAAEVPASGAAVRSIPNLHNAIHASGFAEQTTIVDAAHIAPADQVRLFENTKVLVGQHGAGLTNMLWMRPGSSVIEILPPSPPWVEPIFTNLAGALGHQITVVQQEGPHDPVDATALASALRQTMREAI